MDSTDNLIMGVTGTVLSGTGITLSVTELQGIISIIITILGFIISVMIPCIVKIVNKVKQIKADGKVTAEEVQDLKNTTKEVVEEIKDGINDLKNKK